MTGFSVADLDDLEKPVKRARFGKAIRGGPTERTIQREIVKGLRLLGLIVHHSPNGAHLAGDDFARLRQTTALKADGVLPGFPDLVLIHRGGETGYLEVKRPGGQLEASQEALLPKIAARCPRLAVVTSLDEALAAVTRWGWLP